MKPTLIAEPYERGLEMSQIESLSCGVLRPILDLVKSSSDYQIEFRDKYFNIYYKGGSLLRIGGVKKPSFSFDIRYCLNEKSKYKALIDGIKRTDITALANNIDCFTFEMNAWFDEHFKKERQLQQLLCEHNRICEKKLYIVDIEFAATGDGRADMLAVKQLQSGAYKIFLIEYKQGNGAISSGLTKNSDGRVVATKSGLFKHYVDAANLITKRKQAIVNTVANSMQTRNRLKISNFDLAELNFDDEIEMLFVLSQYKQNTRAYKNPLVFDNLQKELAAIDSVSDELGLKYTVVSLDNKQYEIDV